MHCRSCRTDPSFRLSLMNEYPDVTRVDFKCPYGVTEHNLGSRGVGDTVAKAIHTLTRGTVKPCPGCRKRQKLLNRLIPYKAKEIARV